MPSTPSFLPPDPLGSDSPSPLAESVEHNDPLAKALEVLQDNEHDAARWLDVALAFRVAGQPIQAIDACEACLKLDPRQVEGWFLIAELAKGVGHHEMAGDAYDVARQLAPDDSRLPSRTSEG